MKSIARVLLVVVLMVTLVCGLVPIVPAASLISEVAPHSGDPIPPICPPPTRSALPATPLGFPGAPL